MLDQKMIEKLERLDNATILRRLPDSERNFFEYCFQRGYNRAINEFLKGLWHDASEEPKERNENIIVLQDENDEDEGNPLYAGLKHARHDAFPWDEFCEDNDIYKWCYFKEIAPRKGGKQ